MEDAITIHPGWSGQIQKLSKPLVKYGKLINLLQALIQQFPGDHGGIP